MLSLKIIMVFVARLAEQTSLSAAGWPSELDSWPSEHPPPPRVSCFFDRPGSTNNLKAKLARQCWGWLVECQQSSSRKESDLLTVTTTSFEQVSWPSNNEFLCELDRQKAPVVCGLEGWPWPLGLQLGSSYTHSPHKSWSVDHLSISWMVAGSLLTVRAQAVRSWSAVRVSTSCSPQVTLPAWGWRSFRARGSPSKH